MAQVILVDGTSYIFRAFHALPRLTTASGMNTGAIYGFCSMFKKLLADHANTPVVLFFDAGGDNFRTALYPEYKANRKEIPPELKEQLTHIYEIAKLFGVPIITQFGVEADDLIGTVAAHYAQLGEVFISSADKDFCQLINEKIYLENTQESRVLTIKGVVEKYGINPTQFIDYLALIGDSSDNIPGVPKVGKVTAVKWLTQYGSLDNLIINQESITGKVAESFRAHTQDALLSRQLATIKRDLPWPDGLSYDAYPACPALDLGALAKQYELYEFKSLIPKRVPEKKEIPPYKILLIDNQEKLTAALRDLSNQSIIAIDLETTSLSALDGFVCGIGLCGSWDTSYYIASNDDSELIDRALKWLLDAFTNSNQKWIAHNWKFDGAFLYHFIKKLPCHYADTMLMSYILKAEEKHDLKSLAFNYLNWPLESYESVLGQHDSFKNVPLDKAAFYGGSDAAATFRLYHLFQHQLDENPTLNKVFNQIDNPLVFILMHMELTGIQLDLELISTLEKELKDSLLKISQNIYHYAGTAFNINSPKQLRSLLFTTLQLPILRKTPKGDPSTDEDVLIDLKDSHPIISLILEYRQLEKLRSTYTFSLIQQIHAKTKRIHTNYHQTGTITGRLSSSSPNLQNIPIKSQYGRKIRQAFIAKPGYLLLSLDYSQIELRLMAHFSNDSNLLNAYNNQQDIHIRTASNLFDRPLATVTDQQRQLAKTVNFGLIYGMSAWGLAKQLHISREQAQAFIDSYFKQYPGVKTYMESMKTFAAEHGYVTTLSGRRIPIDIKSKNNPSQNAFRAAINGPLQGTASDLIKLAMLDIAKEIYSHQDEIELLLQVHDELIFEVKSEFAESWAKKICTLMESVLALNVPLKVNYQLHLNWGFVD